MSYIEDYDMRSVELGIMNDKPQNLNAFKSKMKKEPEEAHNLFKEILKEDSIHANLVLTDEKTAIYNFREYGFQYGGINGCGDHGSVYHHMLQKYTYSPKFIHFLVKASLYCIMYNCYRLPDKIREVNPKLSVQTEYGIIKELNKNDNLLLAEFIDNQVKYYGYDKAPEIKNKTFSNCTLYESDNYILELKDNKVIGVLWTGDVFEFPEECKEAIDTDKSQFVRENFVYILFCYQNYMKYGVNCPREIIQKSYW